MPVRAARASRLLVGVCLAVAVLVCWPAAGGRAAGATSCGPQPQVRAARAAAYPVITFPAQGDRVTDRTPTVTGQCAPPGATGAVRVAGQTLVVVADSEGAWSATPSTLPFGPATVDAEWVVDGDVASADPVAFTVVPRPVIVDTPADGSSTTDRRPLIGGSGAEPGATISVGVDGREWTTTADPAGRWSLRPGTDLDLGAQSIMVVQIVTGTESDPDRLTVIVGSPSQTPSQTPSQSPSGSPSQTPSGSPSQPPSASPRPIPSTSHRPVPRSTEAPSRNRPGEPTSPPPGEPNDGNDPGLGVQAEGDNAASGVVTPSPEPSATAPTPSGPAETPTGGDLLPMRLTIAAGVVVPGQVASFVGSFGPAPGSGSARIRVTGTVNRGVGYRSVQSGDGTCAVSELQFDCELAPSAGRTATLAIRLVADELTAPPYVRQQLTVETVSRAPGSSAARTGPRNTMTRTTPTGPTAVSGLAASIVAGPGLALTVLALYLFALAAAEYERRHSDRRSSRRRPKRGSR